jgi:hypothetical protein
MIGKRYDTRLELVVITLSSQEIRNTGNPGQRRLKLRERREGEKSKIVEILVCYCVWSMKPTARVSRTVEP